MQCNPIRVRVRSKDVAEERRFRHVVVVRETQFALTGETEDLAIQTLYAQIANDAGRNAMIVDDIRWCVRPSNVERSDSSVPFWTWKVSGLGHLGCFRLPFPTTPSRRGACIAFPGGSNIYACWQTVADQGVASVSYLGRMVPFGACLPGFSRPGYAFFPASSQCARPVHARAIADSASTYPR